MDKIDLLAKAREKSALIRAGLAEAKPDGREGKYKITSFNTKDFDEPHASVRAGYTGEWVAVSRLRRVEK